LVATLPELQRLAAERGACSPPRARPWVRVKGTYLDAGPVGAHRHLGDRRVGVDACDGDAEGARLAAQVRASLRA
jgi:hypothetical protein